MKKIALVLFLVLSLSLTACSGSNDKNSYGSSTDSKAEYSYDYNSDEGGTIEKPMEEEVVSDSTITQGNRKIISKAEVYIETLEFDKAIEQLNSNIDRVQGYIEASNVYQGGINQGYSESRWGDYTIRVPKEKYNEFINDCKTIGNITNINSSGEDVSSQYYDADTRVKVLKAQEERYLELLKEAKTMEDILKIEENLTKVRYEIESLTGYLKKIDGLVDYGTVTINIREVLETTIVEKTPTTLGGKIERAFKHSVNSLKDVGIGLLLGITVLIPYLIIMVPLAIIVIFALKAIKKRKK